MPVTIVTRLHSVPGAADAVIAAVAEHFDRVVRSMSDWEMAYLFQNVDDPAVLLHVAAWRGSPEMATALDERRTAALPPLDGLLASPPTVQRVQQIETHERIGVRIGAMGCTIVSAHPDRADDLREAVVSDAHAVLRHWSEARGLVLYRVYENLDRPAEFAIVHCWQRADDLAAFAAVQDVPGPRTRTLGADVEWFASESRAMLSRHFPG